MCNFLMEPKGTGKLSAFRIQWRCFRMMKKARFIWYGNFVPLLKGPWLRFRECEEETGFVPGKLIKLVTYAHAEGYSTAFMTLFLGVDLKYTGNVQLDTTEFLQPCTLQFHELKERVQSGQVIDSKTILGTMLAEPRLPAVEKS